MSLQTIVVGYDGSEASDRAIELAVGIVEGTPGEVVVVTAFVSRPQLGTEANAELRAEAEQVAGRGVNRAKEQGLTCRSRVEDGDPRHVVDSVADSEGADLIVIGTRGRGSLTRLLLGSVAAYLVEHSTIPVAVTR